MLVNTGLEENTSDSPYFHSHYMLVKGPKYSIPLYITVLLSWWSRSSEIVKARMPNWADGHHIKSLWATCLMYLSGMNMGFRSIYNQYSSCDLRIYLALPNPLKNGGDSHMILGPFFLFTVEKIELLSLDIVKFKLNNLIFNSPYHLC